jgi:hypothetical protein
MAITSNTVEGVVGTPHVGLTYWTVCAQSADSSGNEILVAAASGKSHYLEKIRVDMCPGAAAASFTINSDTTAVIGPIDLIDTGSTSFEYEFKRPLKFAVGTGIKLDTEAADQIHVVAEGFTA